MDIVRDASVKKKKRQKQTVIIVAAVIAVLGVTLGVSKLKPAPPSVEFGTIWPDTVKRGSMLRQVHGLGSLVPIPDDVRLIPAETDVHAEPTMIFPGPPARRYQRFGGKLGESGFGEYGGLQPAGGAGAGERGPGIEVGRG